MPFNPNDLVRGKFVLTKSRRVINFLYNPTSIKRTHGYAWNSQPIPGRSHPHYSGGVGQDEVISFSLYLDGDRGKSDRRRRIADLETSPAPLLDPVALSVEEELNDLRSLVLPYDKDLGDAHGVPESVIFRYGSVSRAAECLIQSVDEDIIQVTKRLEPFKTLVAISMVILRETNETSWTFANKNELASINNLTRVAIAGIKTDPIVDDDVIPAPGFAGTQR